MDGQTKYTTSIDHFIARIDWQHAPTLPDIMKSIRSVLDSPHYRSGLRLLVVDHDTGFTMSESGIQAAVEAVSPLVRNFRSTALAVGTERDYGTARQFSSCFLKAGIVLGAFKDEVAAGVWLMGST